MKQVEEPRPEQVLEAAPAMVGEPAIEVIGDGTAEGGGAGRGGPSGGPPPRPKGRQSFGTWLADLRTAAGSTGLFPLFVLLGLAAVERFDAQAFGVLGPEIRRSFHLSDSGFTAVFNLSTILPLFLAVFIGAASDRYNRSRITATAGWLWGATAVLTGLSPILGVLIAARLLGGVGLLVNEPVHPSLLADYYQPEHLPRVMSIHRQGSTIGLLGGPLAGVLVGAGIGWRPTFVLLAAPTFVLAAFALRLREPSRGGTLAMAPPADEHVPIGEAFRRLRSIRTLKRTWVAAFFFGSGVLPLINILNLYFDDVFHAGPAVRGGISFLYGLFGVFGLIIGARYTERLSTERGPRWLPIVNGAMIIELAVGLVLLAASPWIAAAAICNAIIGLGAFGFFPAYLTMVARVTPPRLRSQAFSWSLIWFALGGLILSQIAVGFDNRRVTLLVLAAFVAAGGIAEITAEKFVERDIDQAANAEATSTSTALLACHKLDAGYDQVQILFGVDLEIFEGEIVALLGTNGAGKSTLLKAISGLIDPIGGAVYFDGRDITHADANTTAKLGIAQVPGGRGIFPTLSVGENLRIAGWMYRSDAAHVKEATERVLEYFPVLRSRWDTAAGSLSGGEQQMLSLGQAFIAQPKLMLIDELSLGLAPTVVEQLLEIVRAIHDKGTTIILVEQSVNIALRLAQRALFMEKGEVRFSGPTAELLERKDILRAVFLKGAGAAGETTNGNGKSPGGAKAVKDRAAAVQARDAAAAEYLTKPVVLRTEGLTKRYGGVTAVDGVDLEVHEGEILGLIGPNGAGKTTIFDLICGFTPLNGGSVHLLGHDVTGWTPDRRAAIGLGRSFQDARLWPSLTVRETIAVGMERHVRIRSALPALLGMPVVAESEHQVREEVDELIGILGLGAFRNKFVSELSTGSRRIVEIAAILAHRPQVLILDEPSSGIAQKETEALGPLLKEAQAYLGCSMLVIEHDMPLITGLADHLVGLDRGTVVTHGRPSAVLQHPHVVESYLGTSDQSDLL